MNNISNIKHTSFGEIDIKDDLKNAWDAIVFTTTSGVSIIIKKRVDKLTLQICLKTS